MKHESVTEASKRLGIKRSTLQRYCRQGRVPGAFATMAGWYLIPANVKREDIVRPLQGRPREEKSNENHSNTAKYR